MYSPGIRCDLTGIAMGFSYDSAIEFRTDWVEAEYAASDVILYALGVGFGQDLRDDTALDFVLETRGPKVLPTIATTLVKSISRDLGLEMSGVVHAAQRLEVISPLPPSARFFWQAVVSEIVDRGPDKGAVVTFETTARETVEGPVLFILHNTLLARRDGGCGGPEMPKTARDAMPDRTPDITHKVPTRADQALLYRLNGDLNPLHVEPEAARKAGFPIPILHGLCTYGIACRAIVEAVCASDPTRLRSIEGKFTAPVFPGDEITVRIWNEGRNIRFSCAVAERDVVVFDDGLCRLFDPSPARN
jgi:acyl dehydratase